MKLSATTVSTVLAGLSLLLAGCPKQPTRPMPTQTVIGTQPGGGNSRQGGIATPTNLGDTGLTIRDPNATFDPLGQMRGRLESVLFALDSSVIDANQRAKLEAAAKYLKDNPNYRLLLEGHCDWRGTSEYNLSLGDRRANAVKKFLETLGVAADRTEIVSKGSIEATKNADEATMAKERNVEFVVVRI